MMKNFINSEGTTVCIIGTKVMAVLLKGWIMPFVKLHQEGSAPAACALGLFISIVFTQGGHKEGVVT